MGRRPREEEEGGIYHVIQRGNNREFVFGDEVDKEYLIGQFMLLNVSGFRVYGFVIMGNHYHIVIRTVGDTLQSIMHRLNLKYSKYYNRKYTRSGHVFQGRYKAIPVRDEKYILGLLRYIHQNPVKAGVCKRTEEYTWSSDRNYREREDNNGWVDTSLVLEMLFGKREEAIKKYIEFMLEEETGDYENKAIIGDTPVNRKNEEIREKIAEGKDLDEILMATGVNEEEFKLIKGGARRRNLTGYKLKYAREALKLNYTLKAIGTNIKVSDVAILDMFKRNNLVT